MAVVVEHEGGDQQGWYRRLAAAAGDIVQIDFRRTSRPIAWPEEPVAIQVTPSAGGTVACTFAFRPDFSDVAATGFRAHESHAHVAAAAAWLESGPLAALRFMPAAAGCVIETRSAVELDWSTIVIGP